jgi:predicted nucleic acid-binding protein
MKVVFDASILLPLLEPGVPVPPPPPGVPAASAIARIEYLIAALDEEGAVALIPTPALSEVLTRSGAATATILHRLKTFRFFDIVPFDEVAAIECAAMLSGARGGGKAAAATWAKVKFDHQIAAVAKVHGAVRIYTDDADLKRLAPRIGAQAIGLWDLPEPPVDPQATLPLGDR